MFGTDFLNTTTLLLRPTSCISEWGPRYVDSNLLRVVYIVHVICSVGELFLPILCLDTTSEYVQKIFQEPSQEMTRKELYMKFYNGNIRKLFHNFPDVRLLWLNFVLQLPLQKLFFWIDLANWFSNFLRIVINHLVPERMKLWTKPVLREVMMIVMWQRPWDCFVLLSNTLVNSAVSWRKV